MSLRFRYGVWHARFWLDGRRVERTTHCTDRDAAEAVQAQLERDAAKKATRQCVYVLAPAARDRIKIGRTTNLPTRMRQIRANSPVPLEILAVLPGDHTLESELHRRFDRLRIVGEWFRGEPELLEFIEAARWGEVQLPKQVIAQSA